MAGNNKCIQLLRGGSSAWKESPDESRQACQEILLDGQPFYDPSTNWLFIGNGTAQLKELTSIVPDYTLDSLTEREVKDIWNNAGENNGR